MFPPGARHQPDGSVTFPARGRPPVCNVPGYIEDPGDEYRWLMVYCPCKHRVLEKPYICKSGKLKHRDFCELKLVPINPQTCKDCIVEPKV